MSASVAVVERPPHRHAPHEKPATTRLPFVVFGGAELFALVLWPVLGRRHWFYLDEWDFLADRKAGNLGDLFRPHNEHWSTVPILVYRAVFSVVGLHSYLPYQLIVVVLHLLVAALVLVVMRRAGVQPWIAVAAATLFVFFGSGRSDIVFAFQMSFTGALALGLAQLLFADHDGGIERRDWFGLLAGLLCLMTSGVGVTMVVVVGIAVLLRRGILPALFHTVPLAAAYVIWFAAIGHEGYASGEASSRHVLPFVAKGFRSTFRSMGQLPGVGILLAVVLLAGLALTLADRSRPGVRARLAAPIALLAGSAVFITIAAIGRASVLGVNTAQSDRYLYILAAMTLPAIAVGADTFARRFSFLLLPLIALLLVGIPGNINTFNKEQRQDRPLGAYRHLISSLAHDPLARQAPPTIRPEPVLAPYVTIGWLVASAGRIPEPGRVKPSEAESNAFRLSFMQQKTSRAAGDCPTPVELPTTVTLARGDAIDLREGPSTFPGASDSMHLAPATHGLFGPALTFAAREGNDVVVLRDVGSVRITSASPFFAPRVCVITP